MDTWKEISCSKSHGSYSVKLADETATLVKHLATDAIITHKSILIACRLVTLKKDNGIKPIGVEKCLQRFIGKAITQLLQRTSFM